MQRNTKKECCKVEEKEEEKDNSRELEEMYLHLEINKKNTLIE